MGAQGGRKGAPTSVIFKAALDVNCPHKVTEIGFRASRTLDLLDYV